MNVIDFIQVLGFMITCVTLGIEIHGILTKNHDDNRSKRKKK